MKSYVSEFSMCIKWAWPELLSGVCPLGASPSGFEQTCNPHHQAKGMGREDSSLQWIALLSLRYPVTSEEGTVFVSEGGDMRWRERVVSSNLTLYFHVWASPHWIGLRLLRCMAYLTILDISQEAWLLWLMTERFQVQASDRPWVYSRSTYPLPNVALESRGRYNTRRFLQFLDDGDRGFGKADSPCFDFRIF